MVYSTSTDSFFDIICIYPQSGATLSEQLRDCYKQFSECEVSSVYSRNSVIKQTILISASGNPGFYHSRAELLKCSGEFFDILPPTTVVAQTPEKKSLLVELTILKGLLADEITHKKNEESSWILIERQDMKILVASGFSGDTTKDEILEQSDTAFRNVDAILKEEKFEFSDITRQWNYIEQITRKVSHNNAISQNYQVFNDVRSKYYSSADFKNGFPSATGIGTDFGGVTIDIIAVKVSGNSLIVPVKSPVQLDAYSYTEKVLAENNSMKDFCRTTPKFERAKILVTQDAKVIFVSGTAAIKGQLSTSEMSVENQAEITIQNILSLISPGNLLKHGIKASTQAEMCNLRVYVKHMKDIRQVKHICLRHFPKTPGIYVVADICRPELLVEIEGQAVVK